ncbi:NADH-quinone oxidoreductase subunit A [Legionella micdadei]|nr:NADH-quinone oxidoreductase subunit A [Legionella micdadei]ARG98805.1 NADH-quinone oxidoreductase subunit A [Legionella micdadei]ARH01523.1 NADH-quinone oxidoreductase subunit A [Legionella micdadei]NSL18081.1 NADH-quinone oxidoreductase subunit A [Legionella micdadei]
MLSQYLPILVFIIIALIIGLAMLGAGALLGTHNPDAAKNSPYECGFGPFENAHLPFDVRFYLVAILFIIFDLETAFFVPWAVVLRKIGWFGFSAMMVFLGLLVIGFIFEWKRGALEWE